MQSTNKRSTVPAPEDAMSTVQQTTEPEPFQTLGEQVVNKDAFEFDLKINEGYLKYSAELLRLSLLAITGLALVWLKMYLPDIPRAAPPPQFGSVMAASFALLTIAAAGAMMHGYTAADSLAYHLTALRRYKRRRPASGGHVSDIDRGDEQCRKRDLRFRLSSFLLRLSAVALMIGVAVFGIAMWTLT